MQICLAFSNLSLNYKEASLTRPPSLGVNIRDTEVMIFYRF
jgi:hypothetical protein